MTIFESSSITPKIYALIMRRPLNENQFVETKIMSPGHSLEEAIENSKQPNGAMVMAIIAEEMETIYSKMQPYIKKVEEKPRSISNWLFPRNKESPTPFGKPAIYLLEQLIEQKKVEPQEIETIHAINDAPRSRAARNYPVNRLQYDYVTQPDYNA